MRPLSGRSQPESELQDGALAGTGHSQQDLGGATFDLEGETVEHDVLIVAQPDILKDDCLRPVVDGLAHASKGPSRSISRRVTNRSTARMRTLAATTAWVVARPTPWVPPVALIP